MSDKCKGCNNPMHDCLCFDDPPAASAGSNAIYAVAFTGMPGNIKVVQVEAPNKEDALLKAMRKEWGVTKIDITCLR